MMKPPATLEPSKAERLLLVTGAIALPDANAVRAANAVWKDLVDLLVDTISQDDTDEKPHLPGRLYAAGVSENYWEKLQRWDPDYAQVIAELGPVDGAAFQALQMAAKDTLMRHRPVTKIDTVCGEREVAVMPEGIEERTFLLRADTIENPRRLVQDLAAAALCYEQVQVFADVFRETYSGLIQMADAALAKKAGADRDWLPPLWLADGLKVFFQEPLGTGLETSTPAPAPLKPQRGKGLDIDSMKGPAEAAL